MEGGMGTPGGTRAGRGERELKGGEKAGMAQVGNSLCLWSLAGGTFCCSLLTRTPFLAGPVCPTGMFLFIALWDGCAGTAQQPGLGHLNPRHSSAGTSLTPLKSAARGGASSLGISFPEGSCEKCPGIDCGVPSSSHPDFLGLLPPSQPCPAWPGALPGWECRWHGKNKQWDWKMVTHTGSIH